MSEQSAGVRSRLRASLNGQDFSFDGQARVTVGRDPEADIPSWNPVVSRRHALLRFGSEGWVYLDSSSTGTYRNGERVSELVISGRTVLRLGDPEMGDQLELDPVESRRVVVASPKPAAEAVTATLGRLSGTYSTTSATRIRIGRAADNDIVVDDMLVSRHHAELIVAGVDYQLIDLQSHNGTFVDGRQITVAPVDERSVIGLGHQQFRLVGGTLEHYVDTGRVEFQAAALSVFVGDHRPILDEVTFSLPEKSFLAIVGPSGAGKSTCMKALTGFAPADAGSVLYNGRDLYTYLDELRPRIGYVPQDDVLHPQLTVRRALEFAAELRFPPDVSAAERSKVVGEVIEELGLSHRAELPISKLSGGQRKRTSIALELLTKPSLLFLDEPTSGLDPGLEKSVMELLRTLADGGRTVIVVTHSLQSLDLCDRILFLAPGGATAYFGPPAEALGYFGREDYADVFRSLEEATGWKERFAGSEAHDRYVGAAAAVPPVAHDVAPSRPPQRSWFGQLSTLVRRQIAIIAADRGLLLMLAALAPAMGLLLLAFIGAGGLKAGSVAASAGASKVVIGLAFCVGLLGLLSSFREIVKELPIFRRERSTGLSTSAYLASKLLVFGPFVVVQGVVITALIVARQQGPHVSNVIQPPLLELMVDMALTGVAAMVTGLVISAAVATQDKAVPVVVLVVLLQLVATGALFPIKGGAAVVTSVVSVRWGFAAAASSVDVPTLMHGQCVEDKPGHAFCDPSWRHTARAWGGNLAGLAVIIVVGTLAAAFFLRRRDPTRGRRRRVRA